MLTTDASSTINIPKGLTVPYGFVAKESDHWRSLADKLAAQGHLSQADLVAIKGTSTTGVYQHPSATYFNVAATTTSTIPS